MSIEHIRLSELTISIGNAIRDRFGGLFFWVMADVTSHQYRSEKKVHHFDLVEKDPSSGKLIAKVSAKAWGEGTRAIEEFEKNTGQKFSGNISVLVKIQVEFHDLYSLQANLIAIDANYTLGTLEQQRRQTLLDLVEKNPGVIMFAEGKYLTRNNKLQLPAVIQRIAVISSRNSAGAEDLRHTLHNNAHGYFFLVEEYHAPVQGEHYVSETVQQLINIFESGKKYDAVVITRGGGSQTDFLMYDHYSIARAVARFPVPVITGIGHQKNESITDLMAHTSTKTPTKAAEFIIAHNRMFEEQVLKFQKSILIRTQQQFGKLSEELSFTRSKLVNSSSRMVASKKELVNGINQTFTRKVNELLFKRKSDLMEVSGTLLSKPRTMIGNYLNDLLNIQQNTGTFTRKLIKSHKSYLGHYESIIRVMSPANILQKGFAIIKSGGSICADPGKLQVGNNIEIVMSAAKLEAQITGKTDQHATTDL